ncbi:Zinc/iron permease [Suhomyces tanzawaensis NRRL Y-17324]|uniref:Zinc/iron permease n=1 Tax=Suhomyces tanzawaensis NRRL Y-17324 TaxID=984487 RepID=A0A1E4SPN4_9ASCO|nr:Zinc/iron permease [Suhomyces tanzawaensis NRRL Y-17324]ODV81479.1 Zinc/iron permease [Suhomyces tanzawaensis NRRL Y-17324]
MVHKLVQLVLLTSIMGVSSFLGGIIPLKIPMNSSKLNYMSIFSMGILISTSLVLIIPEGVLTLYGSLHQEDLENAPKYLGLALLGGFILMYIVDGLPALLSTFNLSVKFDYTVEANKVSFLDILKSIVDSSITLGLIFHALIDGISLGSSLFSDDISFQLFFFIAIIIHKLPTAFSFTSILLRENFNTTIILVHLILFSLSTPVSAIVTYLIVSTLGSNNKFVIGMLFLFSAGTFLYVVNHVVTGISNGSNTEYTPTSSESEEHAPHRHLKLSGIELLVSVAGMTIPILMSLLGSD